MVHTTTIIYEIIKYLELHPLGCFGGEIEDYMRMIRGTKGDTTARRLREMVEDGIILNNPRQIDNKGKWFNYYVLPEAPKKVLPQFAREVIRPIQKTLL